MTCTIPKFPMRCECGSTLFQRSLKTGGWWKEIVDGNTGEIVDTDLDSVKYGPEPKTVTCADCSKRHPNPRFFEGKHVQESKQ